MKKQVLATTTAATLIASGTVVAHADTVQPVVEATTTTTQVVEVGQENTVTLLEVNEAKQAVEEAQSNVDKQQPTADKAQSEESSAIQGVEKAENNVSEAEKLAAQATPENIDKAATAISVAEQTVADNAVKLAETKEKEVLAKSKVTDQENVVNKAKVNASSTQDSVNSAQNDLAEKQAILDGTGASDVIAKAEQAKLQQSQDEKAVEDATSELQLAKVADESRQATISEDEKDFAMATAEVAENEALANVAQTKAEQSAKELAATSIALTKAEANLNAINTLSATDDYVKYLKQYVNSDWGSLKYDEAKAKLKEINAANVALNTYKANSNDSTVEVNINELTEEQRKELSLFAQDLVNQVRRQFGTEPTVVTADSLKFADKVTDGYVADNWSWDDVISKMHDERAINVAAREMGLENNADNTMNYYENAQINYGSSQTISMAEAKEMVYDGLTSFLFNGDEWLHAKSIAGVYSDTYIENIGGGFTEYLAADFSSTSDITMLHMLLIPEQSIEGDFDITAIVNPNTSETIIETYNKVKLDFENKSSVNTKYQDELVKTKTELATSQTKLAEADQKLTTDKATPAKTPSAETKLQLAMDALTKSTTENTKAQQAVENLNSDVQVKTKAVNDAKAVLAQKQALLEQASKVLDRESLVLNNLTDAHSKAKQAVSAVEKELEASKTNLVNAKTYLNDLKDSSEKLEVARVALLEAKEMLAKAKANNNIEQEKVAIVKEIRDEKLATYKKLKTKYDEQVEVQRLKELETKRKAIVSKGQLATPVLDVNGKAVDYIVVKPNQANVTYQTASFVSASKTAKQGLPNTGEKGGVIATAVGGLLLAMGLSFKKREAE